MEFNLYRLLLKKYQFGIVSDFFHFRSFSINKQKNIRQHCIAIGRKSIFICFKKYRKNYF